MVLVRLLLFLALAAILVALLLYLFTRDRRYLRFILQVAKFWVIAVAGILLYFAADRLWGPMLPTLGSRTTPPVTSDAPRP